jgi:transposase
LGRSRGGLTTKIHLAADAKGRPLRFILTGGHVHDVTQAAALVEGWQPSHVIADKGYDSRDFVDGLEQAGARAVIPPRSSRKNPRAYDAGLYKERNLSERCFNKLKHFRRTDTRYDRKAAHFLAFLPRCGLRMELIYMSIRPRFKKFPKITQPWGT